MIGCSDEDLEALRQRDQLNIERAAQRSFHGFTEGPLTFRPTYKFQVSGGHEWWSPCPRVGGFPLAHTSCRSPLCAPSPRSLVAAPLSPAARHVPVRAAAGEKAARPRVVRPHPLADGAG